MVDFKSDAHGEKLGDLVSGFTESPYAGVSPSGVASGKQSPLTNQGSIETILTRTLSLEVRCSRHHPDSQELVREVDAIPHQAPHYAGALLTGERTPCLSSIEGRL